MLSSLDSLVLARFCRPLVLDDFCKSPFCQSTNYVYISQNSCLKFYISYIIVSRWQRGRDNVTTIDALVCGSKRKYIYCPRYVEFIASCGSNCFPKLPAGIYFLLEECIYVYLRRRYIPGLLSHPVLVKISCERFDMVGIVGFIQVGL